MDIQRALQIAAFLFVVLAPLLFVATFLTAGKRMFTRAFWRYSSGPTPPSDAVDDLVKGTGHLLRWIALGVLWVLKWAIAIGIVLGVLYGIVWLLHAMWRAT